MSKQSHTPGPTEWLKEDWTVGQYTPSDTFKAIANHSCVCRKCDMGLVAITGPADDRESQRMADLFAAAPALLVAAKGFVEYIREYFHDDLQCDHGVGLCGCSLKGELREMDEAIKRAEGGGK